jgi:putative ABC transport system ATP-binding protein
VLGPSGSGKSTLLHLLAGLDTPDAGAVHIAGEDITRMSDKELTRLRRKHIGFVFQSFNLLPTLSAEENVLLPLSIAGRRPEPHVVDELLTRMGLAERRDHKPAQLSGGQQQRVAVARALIATPTVLFADEPTGNLDSAAGADVLDLLRSAVDEDGQTTVMVTHDARAAATADRVLFLADGRVVADLAGPTEEDILSAMKDAARA